MKRTDCYIVEFVICAHFTSILISYHIICKIIFNLFHKVFHFLMFSFCDDRWHCSIVTDIVAKRVFAQPNIANSSTKNVQTDYNYKMLEEKHNNLKCPVLSVV